jgi:hypothetical protein
MRRSASIGAVSTISARVVTVPTEPSWRLKRADPDPPATMPALARIASTVASSRSWFFAENASRQGGMTATRCGSSPAQTYCWRVKTCRCVAVTYGSRNDHAARVRSSAASAPTCDVKIVRAPLFSRLGARPSV